MSEMRLDLYKFLEYFKNKKEVEFKKGDIVLQEGSKIETIDFLVDGNVYISRNLKDGKRVIANNLEAPQILSLIEVLNSEKEVLSDVFALNNVKILKIQIDEFLEKINDIEVKNASLEYLAKFSYGVIKHSMEYEKYEVEKAILKYYLHISKDSEDYIINLKNSFVADMFRISERTLYRYLNLWEKRGLIRREKRNILIDKDHKKKILKFLDE